MWLSLFKNRYFEKWIRYNTAWLFYESLLDVFFYALILCIYNYTNDCSSNRKYYRILALFLKLLINIKSACNIRIFLRFRKKIQNTLSPHLVYKIFRFSLLSNCDQFARFYFTRRCKRDNTRGKTLKPNFPSLKLSKSRKFLLPRWSWRNLRERVTCRSGPLFRRYSVLVKTERPSQWRWLL